MSPSPLKLLTSIHPLHGSDRSPGDVARDAREAEVGGVDRVLVGYTSPNPDGWIVSSYVLASTSTLKVLLAHRPGVMHPVVAARQAATLQYISEGRLALNVVTGGSPADQLREGDDLQKSERYARSIEYVEVMKKVWSATSPVSHEGRYYRANRALLSLRPPVDHPVPIFMGGASDDAIDFGVRSADVYMLWGEPLAETAERLASIRERAAALQLQKDDFSMSFRIILGDTAEQAWARADAILQTYEDRSAKVSTHAADVGRTRQLEIARENTRQDTNFWGGITLATAGQGSTSAIVGTEDEVVASLAKYRELGINMFLLTGGDGVWTDELTPLLQRLRQELA